jgi:hypothetical protein
VSSDGKELMTRIFNELNEELEEGIQKQPE